MKLIDRRNYLQQLNNVKDILDIKVITGIRRSGKCKLVDAFSAILEADVSSNVVRIKLNQKKFEDLLELL